MTVEFEPSNPFNLAAKPGTPSEPAQQALDVQAQQTQQTMPEQKPFGWTDWAKKAAMKNGDYFEHDNKIFNQRDGKTFLVTGDGMGDVELDEGQAGQLAKEREDKAAREKAEKEGPVYTDQVPGGVVMPNDPQYAYDAARKKKMTPEERDESKAGGSLVAGNGDLCHYDANGNLVAQYPYTSGVDGVSDPSIPYKGPIPPGEYTFNTGDIDEVHGLRYIKRRITGDWGNYRVPLNPAPETETHGRNNFFLHGGDTPGSLGCIDVGKFDKYLFPSLKEGDGSMRLTVK